MKKNPYLVFSGSSHPLLARRIVENLKGDFGSVQIDRFPDGEIGVQVLEKVSGKDVFILQSPAGRPNHYLMELLILVDAMKRASARSIAVVMPYFPYSRQDRRGGGQAPITARLIADMLEKAGVTRLLTMDLHTEQIQGFFNIPVDLLRAFPLLAGALRRDGFSQGVVVAPDLGSSRMARKYAEVLGLDVAIVDKRRVSAERVEAGALIGDVNGKNALIVDDICSTGRTLEKAARICRENGAKTVLAAVTHGLFVGSQLPKGIDRLYVTDTILREKISDKEVQVSVAPLFAEAIEEIVQTTF